MRTAFPEMTDPAFTTLVGTSTPMYAGGAPLGGPELFPGRVVQVMPQAGGSALRRSANPLKLAGAGPPLSWLRADHCAPQKVTCPPTGALRSPTVKPPRARNAKT